MNVEAQCSRSLWMEGSRARAFSPLEGRARADALVIGGGVAGLMTGYELIKLGREVMFVDRGRFARGMSARTSAHLSFELDDFYHELAKLRGQGAARHYYESQSAGVDRMEEVSRLEGIDCDFVRVDGYFVPAEPKDSEFLEKELAAARAAGFRDAEWMDKGPGPFAARPALRFPRQARFHPLKFLDGLIDALERLGARFHDKTAIVELKEKDGAVSAASEAGAVVEAKTAIVATNTPFHLRIPIHTKQAPYRTYVIAARIPKGSAPDALIWDTLDPYHYLRLQPGAGADWLIVGGEDHKTGEADDMSARLARLEQWTRARFPDFGKPQFSWSGQVYEPADLAPFIGRSPGADNIFLVTGDSGQGLTTGAAAALILRDLAEGRDNPWTDVYEPDRLMIRAGLGEYVKENLDAARHWAAHLRPAGDAPALDALQPGKGGLVREKGRLLAAYRHESGALSVRSATCTHAGCVVAWNAFERCWDCPCHGSQFAVDGSVLQGPAAKPLGDPDMEAAETAAPKARAAEAASEKRAD